MFFLWLKSFENTLTSFLKTALSLNLFGMGSIGVPEGMGRMGRGTPISNHLKNQ